MSDPTPSSTPADAAPLPPELRWSGLTHIGRVRRNNEDAFLALTFDGHEVHYLGKTGHASLADADFVFAVSDGMGGAKAGEFASRITVDKITHLLPRSFKQTAMGLDAVKSDHMLPCNDQDQTRFATAADLIRRNIARAESGSSAPMPAG